MKILKAYITIAEKWCSLFKDFFSMPKVEIRFSNPTVESKDMFLKTYENFTKRHRLYLFKNKTLGVALIDLKSYKNYSVYYEKVNGKNSPAYYSRKALTECVNLFETKFQNNLVTISFL